MMFGIDVSANQPSNICQLVNYDFAIVKASGNPPINGYKWNYRNKYMKQQVDDALARTGCAGLYHFTYGKDAVEEADLFIDTIADYIGRAIPVLDYEAPFANKNNREWCRTFIRRVKERTGVTPFLYSSSSVIQSQNLVELCREEGCGLWAANYWAGSKIIDGYNTSGLKKNISECNIWQFTEYGYLKGYSDRLDLDEFYGDKNDWLAFATGNGTVIPSTPSGYDPDIAELQTECNAQGFSKQNVDGIAGKNTLAGCPTIRKGASGNITKWIQKRLIKLGYSLPKYGADGKFGEETYQAVRKFQQANGLSVDGIVGKNTWRKLIGM